MIKIYYLLILLILLTISGCNEDGKQFGFLDNTDTPVTEAVVIKIKSAVPSDASITLSSTATQTFSVVLEKQDDNALYNFVLDDVTSLQNGSLPYFNLDANTISYGTHKLSIIVSNSTSSDSHDFTVIKNHPATLNSISPTSGGSIQCNTETQTLTTLYADVNAGDHLSIRWYVDDILVTSTTPGITRMNDPDSFTASAQYHPDCASTGLHFIKAEIYDGHESTTQTWNMFVIAPITVAVQDFTPTANPVVLTAATSSTFAVSLVTPDSSANFNFILDGVTSLQNSHKSYYTLSGNPLTVGDHTLAVVISNSNSTTTKTFNVRRNSAPAITGYSPAYSGTITDCGTTPVVLYADLFDANGDSLTINWTLDDGVSPYLVASNTSSKAQATFTPHCSLAGTRVIKATINDGYESVVLTWSVNVTSPLPINISAYTPASNPTVMLANSNVTYSIALTNSDANVTYSFVLKNLTTNISTTMQSGPVPFYNLAGNSLASGLYELTANASNGSSSDSHVFSIRKNTPPNVPQTPYTYSPALTGVILDCGLATQVFTMPIGDNDNDIMAVTWTIDGATSATGFSTNNSQTSATATYSPSCVDVGTKTIKVDVYDGYETSSTTWTVSVNNPTVVSINAYSPSTDPIIISSNGSQAFSVNATGKIPLAYEWKLDGSVISAATNSYTTITGASLSTGPHTLIAKVSDSTTNQSKTFNIIKNAPPVLANITPSNTSPKININTILNLSANFSDANNDSLTIVWKLNNNTVSVGNTNASVSSNSTTTTLQLSPTSTIIGQNTITLTVSDGTESATQTWNVTVNYFSDTCNSMGASRICTISGRPGLGSNINPSINPEKVRIAPWFITPYTDGVSYFFSDRLTHTVWFYNKGATTINMLGQSIAAGKMRVVLGTGVCGTGNTATYYNDFPLCTPTGIAWDGSNLFVGNESSNRIVKVDSSGLVKILVSGNSNNNAGNTNGALTTAHFCGTPRGLQYVASEQRVYVACNGSGTIKYIDTSNVDPSLWTMSIFIGKATGGVTSNTAVDGTNGIAGTAQTNGPNNIKYDSTNKVMYVIESGSCRIRVIENNSSTRTNFLFGSTSLNSNSTLTVLGTSCTTFAQGAVASSRFNGGYVGIEPLISGSSLSGIFYTDSNSHRVVYYNNTASSVTVGNATVAAYNTNTIWGNGTAAYSMPCSSASSGTCFVNTPSALSKMGNNLFLADYSNYRIRYLPVTVTNGTVTDDIGFDTKSGFAGNNGVSSEFVQYTRPLNLFFDDSSNNLYISDNGNARIRKLNLTTGIVSQAIGNGSGNGASSNADPTTVLMQGPRGITSYRNFITYSDTQNAGLNCLIRSLNSANSIQTIFSVLTNSNAVNTVAGNYGNGCGAYNFSASSATDSYVYLNQPQSITNDGTNLYIANTNAHCILKVTDSGVISVLSGQCNSAGSANTTAIAYNNATVKYTYPADILVDPRAPYNTTGNLFILDQTTSGPSRIRYLNQGSTAVTIFGVTVNGGDIKTVYIANDGYAANLAAFDNQVCFSSGGNYNFVANGNASNSNNNVVCFDRDDSTSTIYYRFGRNPVSYIGKGAIQEDTEEEGIAASMSSLATPAGLAFDSNGNLYISERDASVIRMIKKWW